MSVAALATRARSSQKRRLERFDFQFPRIDAASQIGHDATGPPLRSMLSRYLEAECYTEEGRAIGGRVVDQMW
jgi:hypothetical protein